QQRISTNTLSATQSYYTDQAGLEDALLRLKNNPSMSSLSYSLSLGNSSTSVTIPAIVGGSRTITSQANNSSLIKTSQVVWEINGSNVSFHYGVQVGAGGLS